MGQCFGKDSDGGKGKTTGGGGRTNPYQRHEGNALGGGGGGSDVNPEQRRQQVISTASHRHSTTCCLAWPAMFSLVLDVALEVQLEGPEPSRASHGAPTYATHTNARTYPSQEIYPICARVHTRVCLSSGMRVV